MLNKAQLVGAFREVGLRAGDVIHVHKFPAQAGAGRGRG